MKLIAALVLFAPLTSLTALANPPPGYSFGTPPGYSFGTPPGYSFGTPPSFDLAKFQHLISVAADKGELLQPGNGYDFKTLTRVTPSDATKPHHADYFSDLGGADSNGKFGTAEVSMESEDWRVRANGDWEIEEWNWTAFTDGTLVQIGHYLLVESKDGSVLDDQVLPAGAVTDAAELARWEAKVTEWEGLAGSSR